MTDPVDDLKSIVRETEREARESLVAGRCWWFHRWTKWTLADDTGAQHRQCVRCGLAQRVGGKVLCSHHWSTMRVTKVFANEDDKLPKLRETAIPDVVALLKAERAAAIARLQAVVSFAESIHPEITQYDSWRRIAGAPGMAPIAP